MTLTGPDIRILQVHPTRFCNMHCLHCYSSSGPSQRDFLEVPLLLQAIRDAAQLGYNVLSISGGEPLLYPGLRELCDEARAHRMIVTLVTNGTALTEPRVAMLSGAVDVVAISLDGEPQRHNRIRCFPRAFEMMERNLDLLRRAAIPFAFVFTLTRDNLSELEWAADFAVAQGATMLQVHPVEAHGRAASDPELQSLSQQELATAWLVVECLRNIHEGRLTLQLDVLLRTALPVEPEEIAGFKRAYYRGERELGEVVSPLVIEDDGTVVPLRYGFPRSLGFGNLRQHSLDQMATNWKRRRAGRYCTLYRRVLKRFRSSQSRFANIYGLLSDAAAASPARANASAPPVLVSLAQAAG